MRGWVNTRGERVVQGVRGWGSSDGRGGDGGARGERVVVFFFSVRVGYVRVQGVRGCGSARGIN